MDDVSSFLASCRGLNRRLIPWDSFTEAIQSMLSVFDVFGELFPEGRVALGGTEKLIFYLLVFSFISFSIKSMGRIGEITRRALDTLPFSREAELLYPEVTRPIALDPVNLEFGIK